MKVKFGIKIREVGLIFDSLELPYERVKGEGEALQGRKTRTQWEWKAVWEKRKGRHRLRPVKHHINFFYILA